MVGIPSGASPAENLRLCRRERRSVRSAVVCTTSTVVGETREGAARRGDERDFEKTSKATATAAPPTNGRAGRVTRSNLQRSAAPTSRTVLCGRWNLGQVYDPPIPHHKLVLEVATIGTIA